MGFTAPFPDGAMYSAYLAKMVTDWIGEGGEIRKDVNLDDAVLALIAMVEQKCWLWLLDKKPIEPDFGDNCPTDPFEVSDADTMLAYLKGQKPEGVSEPVKAFEG